MARISRTPRAVQGGASGPGTDRPALPRQDDSLAAEAGGQDLEALEFQGVAQAAHQIRLVLDDQDPAAAARRGSRRRAHGFTGRNAAAAADVATDVSTFAAADATACAGAAEPRRGRNDGSRG